jgi:preprotein translocase subunit Sec63
VRALRLALLWAAWAALLSLARAWTVESTPFDPWDILQVPRGADEKAVRRAYRGLSLQVRLREGER